MEHGELIKLVQRESIFQEQSRSLYLGHAKKKWMRKLTFLQGEGVELVGVRRPPPKKKTEKKKVMDVIMRENGKGGSASI